MPTPLIIRCCGFLPLLGALAVALVAAAARLSEDLLIDVRTYCTRHGIR